MTPQEKVAKLRAAADAGKDTRWVETTPFEPDDEPYVPDPMEPRYGAVPCRCGHGQTMMINSAWWCSWRVRHVTGPVSNLRQSTDPAELDAQLEREDRWAEFKYDDETGEPIDD